MTVRSMTAHLDILHIARANSSWDYGASPIARILSGEEHGPECLVGGGRVPTSTPGCEFRPELCDASELLREELRDGGKMLDHALGILDGLVFRAPGDEPRPTILVNCAAYETMAKPMEEDAIFYATRGYAYVLVWQSGPREEVADRIFERWAADAARVLDWIGEQPWCNGDVGTHGTSLVGSTAYAATQASMSPKPGRPTVRALAPVVSFSHVYPTIMLAGRGIATELVFRFMWMAEIGTRVSEIKGVLNAGNKMRMLSFFAFNNFPGLWKASQMQPLSSADEAMWGRPNKIIREGISSLKPEDPFWARSLYENDSKVEVSRDVQCDLAGLHEKCPPLQIIAGFWDIFLQQSLDDYAAGLKAHGKHDNVKLLVFASEHLHAASRFAEISVNHLGWFDKHLMGLESEDLVTGWVRENGVFRPTSKNVILEVFNADGGDDRWLEFDTYPPSGTSQWELFFHGQGGKLGELRFDRDEQPTQAPLNYAYDPRDPTPYVGGGWLNYMNGGPKSQRNLEMRSDVLVLTSKPLSEAVTVVGPLRATLFVRCSAPQCDVVVRFCIVRAATGLRHLGNFFDTVAWSGLGTGQSLNLCEGFVRQNFCNEAGKVSTDPVRVEIELLPTCTRFHAGDCMRLQICSAAHPKYQRHSLRSPAQPAGDWLGEYGLGPPATIELFNGHERRCSLQVPVM